MNTEVNLDIELRRVGHQLHSHLSNPKTYILKLEAVAAQLVKLNYPISASQLQPVVSTIERHIANMTDDINDFIRLARSLNGLWHISGRDITLLPLSETLARRFGLILSKLDVAEPAVDSLFDVLFFMVFKSSSRWHETMAWLNPQMVDSYFGYLDRVYPVSSSRDHSEPRKQLRVGYLVSKLELEGSFAIGRMLYSIMRGHTTIDSHAEIFIYGLSKSTAQSVNAFAGLANVQVRQLHSFSSLEEKAYCIALDSLDALVLEGCSAEGFRLMQKRIVRHQFYMPLGMHPMQASFFDGYLIYENLARNALELGIPREVSAVLPWRLHSSFLNPVREDIEIENARRALPLGKPIFATFCRMEKLTYPVLHTLAELLREVPNAALLLAGPNDKARVSEFFAKQGLRHRVALPGSVDPHVFHNLIDVFVDTFPMCGGLAPLEAMAKGVPVVFLRDPGTESSLDLRDPALCARDTIEYVSVAARLARDPDFLAARRQAAREIASKTTVITDTASAIVQHIKKLVYESQT
jgi:glycosyltransferase involved in cell wall biosynthesis